MDKFVWFSETNQTYPRTSQLKRITQYEGLYGDARGNPEVEYVFSEPLETRGEDFGWTIRPHIHRRLLQLFLIEEGSFEFLESSGQRSLKGPCILLIPSASLHGMNYQGTGKGRILTISDGVLEPIVSTNPNLTLMLSGVQCLTEFNEPDAIGRFRQALEITDQEIFSNQPERRAMLQACIRQVLILLYRFWLQDKDRTVGPDSLVLQYFRKFQDHVRKASARHTVAEAARQLNITTVHLNRICQSVASKPAGDLMQEHLLDEARKYLTYTSYSVSEIAYQLGFEYPNYFARFFKKHLGVSPSEFRKEHGLEEE